jgi:hypothetical protein
MEPPYRTGDPAVRFILSGDTVQVYTTRIIDMEAHGDGWRVWDHAGIPHVVDGEGVGTLIVPVDQELARELATKGEGFTVVEEGRLRGLELIEEMAEPDLDGGRDGV